MRINHNLMALNTNRQLGINGENSQKSIEKLSSGLRINRAGDDAAGLAISEKMRAQIRGLDQASRNAQDGISMVQTAEGALQETQSILQRMRELANQAANDTNVGQDRSEIQKEINALTSEINRIGNTTEFNTQKLLNGGDGKTTNIRYSVMKTGDPATGSAVGAVSTLNEAQKSVKAGTAAINFVGNTTASRVTADDGTIGSPLTETVGSVAAGTVDFNEAQHEAGDVAKAALDPSAVSGIVDPAAAATDKFTIDFASALTGKSQGEITSVSIGGQEYSFAIGATDADSITNLTTAIKNDITGAGAANYTNIDDTKVTSAGTSITFESDAPNVNITIGTFTTDGTNTAAEVAAAVKTGGSGAVYSFEFKANFTAGDSITIGTQTFTARAGGAAGANEFNIGADTAASVSALQAKLSAHASFSNYAITTGSPDWTGDTNSITIRHEAVDVDANAGDFNGATANQTTAVEGQYKFEIASNFEAGQKINIGGQVFEARALGGANDATGFAIGADINDTATNLLAAINANGTLSGQFDAAVLSAGNGGSIAGTTLDTDKDTIVLQEKVASGDTMAQAIPGGVTKTDVAQQAGVTKFDISTNFSLGDKIEIDGVTLTAGTEFAVGADASATAKNLMDAINANATLKNNYTASTENSTFVSGNRIVLTEKAPSIDGNNLAAPTITKATAQTGSYEFLVSKNFANRDRLVVGGEAFMAGTDFQVGANANDTATNIKAALENNDTLNGKYNIAVSGDKITLTEKTATGTALAAPTVSAGAIAGEFKFSTSAMEAGSDITIDGQKLTFVNGGNEAGTASELKTLIQGNKALNDKYSVEVNGADVTLTQKAGQESAASPTLTATTKAGSGFRVTMQIGANTGQSVNVDIKDMRADALGVSDDVPQANQTVEVDGKKYVVAWTSDATVTNGTDDVGVEHALDVSNHDNATAAVKVIETAINSVSSERSKLGASQNRLEHTIANLDASSENLVAAESRIRDVDMAKEMMNFQKNNILSQAAQAMLAQANQSTQGVLQLLR